MNEAELRSLAEDMRRAEVAWRTAQAYHKAGLRADAGARWGHIPILEEASR